MGHDQGFAQTIKPLVHPGHDMSARLHDAGDPEQVLGRSPFRVTGATELGLTACNGHLHGRCTEGLPLAGTPSSLPA